jgi:hypothetical protein
VAGAGVVAGALVLLAFSVAGPALAQSDETVPEPDVTTIDGATTSILATTTTKPPECKDLVPASAIFVGTVIGVTGDTARYAVAQLRSGELPATRVQVDYPDDIRFIKEGRQYVVGAVLVPATSRYQSKVRPPRDAPTEDPCNARDQVYTRDLDGSPVDTSIFSGLSGKAWEMAWAFLLPTLIAIGVLTVLVLFRRVGVGAFRLTLRRAAAPPRPPPPRDQEPPPPPPGSTPTPSRTPARPGARARR